jgi:hypothetical protein
VIRPLALLSLSAAAACIVQLGASAAPGPLRGSVTSTDRTWVCKSAVALDSVTVTMTTAAPGGSAGTDAIHLESGCTGRIGRIEVTTSVADGVKVAQGVHDLTIAGGRVRCLAKLPAVHQDGIQAMSGTNVTLSGLVVDCGRPQDDLINSNLFVNQGVNSTQPPKNILCVDCVLGAAAAHTVSIQKSVGSGVVDSTLCPARFPKQTLAIGADAVHPVDVGNRVGPCQGPLQSISTAAAQLTYGQPLTLSGSIVADPPVPVVVEARVAGAASFANVATVDAGADDGAWQFVVHPGVRTLYRTEAGGGSSPTVLVEVAPQLELRRLGVGLVATALARRSLAGRPVALEVMQGGSWTAVARYRLGPSSSVAFTPPASPASRQLLRVSIGPTPGYLPAVSNAVVYRTPSA